MLLKKQVIRLKTQLTNINHYTIMLHYALIFVVVAIVAALLGMGTIQGLALQIAVVLVALFAIFWIISQLKK